MAGPKPLPLRVLAIPKVPPFSSFAVTPAAATRWLRSLRQAPDPGPAPARGGGPGGDALLEAGDQLRRAREEKGLGLRQLAQQTRISTAVIEALERGWRDRLPEPAYLRTMLPLLERELGLEVGSLNGALPARRTAASGGGREPLLRRFTPGSIDVFTSWQGTVLYALVTLGLIQLLNKQQWRLASRGLLSSRPIPALERAPDPASSGADATVLAAYPDLRPLNQAAAGQAGRRLAAEHRDPGPDLALGDLGLVLEAPTRVEITSPRNASTTLEAVQGTLTLPVLPPFQLRLTPPPPAGAVRWRGARLAPLGGGEAGRWRYPPAASPVAASTVATPTPSPADGAVTPRP